MTNSSLQFQDKDGNPTATVSGNFRDDDMLRLRGYVQHMERVKSPSLVSRGFFGITGMKWVPDFGISFTCEPYTNAELRALLHVMR